jgi:hypothetical protein
MAEEAVETVKLDPLTGTTIGTQSWVIATEMAAGGEGKGEVIDRIKARVPETTRSGTPNPIAQRVNTVLTQLRQKGWTVEESWKLVPPAEGEAPKPKAPAKKPAKKAASKTKKAPAKKTAAKPKVTERAAVTKEGKVVPTKPKVTGKRKIVKKKVTA